MKAIVSSSPSFQREISLTPIPSVPGSFHLEVSSRLFSAKDPNAKQRNFSVILEREGLQQLKRLIDRSLK